MKHTFIVPCVIVASLLVCAQGAYSCPVRLAYAWLVGLGSQHGTAEYELLFEPDGGHDTGPFTVALTATMGDGTQVNLAVRGIDMKIRFPMIRATNTAPAAVPVVPLSSEAKSFKVVSAQDWRGLSTCSDAPAFAVVDDKLASVSFDDGPQSFWPIKGAGTISIADADFAKRVRPDYPTAALNDRIEGDAAVLVAINPDGSLAEASIYHSSGNDVLDQAALDAAKQTTFKPAHLSSALSGAPIKSAYIIIYTFHPDWNNM